MTSEEASQGWFHDDRDGAGPPDPFAEEYMKGSGRKGGKGGGGGYGPARKGGKGRSDPYGSRNDDMWKHDMFDDDDWGPPRRGGKSGGKGKRKGKGKGKRDDFSGGASRCPW